MAIKHFANKKGNRVQEEIVSLPGGIQHGRLRLDRDEINPQLKLTEWGLFFPIFTLNGMNID